MSPKIFCFDIECSPNLVWAWGLWDQNIGINQIVQSQDILCFAATEIGSNKIECHAAWDDYDAMLRRLHTIMDEADYLIGYNHINYDNKHVRAAFARAGLEPPSPWRDVDLMRVVKKNFKFPSHKLDYVCRALGLDTKVQTGGMDLWTQCMSGDETARRKMLRYNKQDVRISAQLFDRLKPYCDGLNVPLHTDCEHPACNRCNSTNIQSRGFAYTTSLRYRRYRCNDCGGWMRDRKSEPIRTLLANI